MKICCPLVWIHVAGAPSLGDGRGTRQVPHIFFHFSYLVVSFFHLWLFVQGLFVEFLIVILFSWLGLRVPLSWGKYKVQGGKQVLRGKKGDSPS